MAQEFGSRSRHIHWVKAEAKWIKLTGELQLVQVAPIESKRADSWVIAKRAASTPPCG